MNSFALVIFPRIFSKYFDLIIIDVVHSLCTQRALKNQFMLIFLHALVFHVMGSVIFRLEFP